MSLGIDFCTPLGGWSLEFLFLGCSLRGHNTCIRYHLLALVDLKTCCLTSYLLLSCGQDSRKLDQIYCDPVQRLVSDCTLMDGDTAAVSDRKGSFAILSCLNYMEGKFNLQYLCKIQFLIHRKRKIRISVHIYRFMLPFLLFLLAGILMHMRIILFLILPFIFKQQHTRISKSEVWRG